MFIKSVELENIRSYKKENIEFDTGINFLSGDIGSGKSTILLAIEFALLGFKRGDLEGYQLLRKGEREGNVKLTLFDDVNNIEIEIYRRIKKAKSSDTISQETGYIRVDDSISELSAQELNSHIFDLLNFPKDFITKDKNLIYRFTIYTQQEQLKEVLFAENEKRLEIIRKLFNIDKYKQLKDAIQIYLSKGRENKKFLEAKIERLPEIEKEIWENTKEVKDFKEKLNNLKPKEKLIEDAIKKYKETVEKGKAKLERYADKRIDMEKRLSLILQFEKSLLEDEKSLDLKKKEQFQIKEKLKNRKHLENKKDIKEKEILKQKEEGNLIKNELKDFEEKEKVREELLEKINKNRSEMELINSLEKDFDYVLTKCQLKDLEKKIRSVENQLRKEEKIGSELKEKEDEYLRSGLEIENLKKKTLENKERRSEMSHMNNCHVCKQEISSEHKEKIRKDIEDENERIKKEIQDLESKIKNLKTMVKELKRKKDSIDTEKKSYYEYLERFRILEEQEKKQRKRYEELNEMKKKLKKEEEKGYEKKLKEIEKELSESKKGRERLEKIALETEKSQEELAKINLQLSGLDEAQRLYTRNEKEIEEFEEKIEKIKKNLKGKEELEKELKNLLDEEKGFKEKIEKIRTTLDELYEKDKLLRSKMSSLETQINEREKYLREKEKTLKELKEKEEKYKRLLYLENFLSSKLLKIADVVEQGLFTKYYAEFNEHFEYYFRELIEDNEIEVRLNEEFSPVIEQNGYDTDVKNLSGGEKSSLAIAYRLGLKKIIENNLQGEQKLSLLILDEPTDGFSNEQVDRLGNLLKETNLKQIILVSHDEKITGIAQKMLRVEKNNHVSSIV